MCCESCRHYADCEAAGRLKDNCCKKCADYGECHAGNDEEEGVDEISFDDKGFEDRGEEDSE